MRIVSLFNIQYCQFVFSVLDMLNINPVLDKIEFLFNGDEIIIKKHKN